MAPKPDGTPAASSSNTSITSGRGAVAGRRVAASIPRTERRRSEQTEARSLARRDASSVSLPSRPVARPAKKRVIGEEMAAREVVDGKL